MKSQGENEPISYIKSSAQFGMARGAGRGGGREYSFHFSLRVLYLVRLRTLIYHGMSLLLLLKYLSLDVGWSNS